MQAKTLTRIATVALLLISMPALAATWRVDAAHSTLGFSNTYQDVTYNGQFRKFTAQIDYDPADLAYAKFDVTVDITSLDTQNSERDSTALGADFFDTAKFPTAHFVTTAFRKAANGEVLADGELTLRGVTKPVTLVVKFVPNGDGATLDVSTQLQRLDFGIGTGQWADPSMIGNGVSVHAHLLLHAASRATQGGQP
ncbi:MAG TPA: YceI family protein [Rhodanobacteraceae bacterium]|jgi:polyisoprenoid-binding protein YceI|nr:YceI family protein [Rhodanobacteraceae bacterium]